jgi:hypothetical protein
MERVAVKEGHLAHRPLLLLDDYWPVLVPGTLGHATFLLGGAVSATLVADAGLEDAPEWAAQV